MARRIFPGSCTSPALFLALGLLAACGSSEPGAEPVSATCGDGKVDEGEACDEGAANSDTAPDACRTDCRPAVCGDGVIDTAELCDDGDENSDTTPGACRTDCTPPRCGDGAVDDGEACDEGAANGDEPGATCRADCTPARCGDGVIDPGEACDDGAENSDAEPGACRTACTLPVCGDGVVDPGEACDDGEGNSDFASGACRTTCVAATCGDGVVDAPEECDDGEANDDDAPDACRTNCQEAWCGDGVVDDGESCDGDLVPSCEELGFKGGTATCNGICGVDTSGCYHAEICGNGIDDDRDGAIDCDDDDCASDLEACANCGDGVRTGDELCDGADLNGTTCADVGFPLGGTLACAGCGWDTSGCYTTEVCGNGRDDDGDGDIDCDDSECAPNVDLCPVCGDGVATGGEACDDGNLANGDGCDSTCEIEISICTQAPDAWAVGTFNPNNGVLEVTGDTSTGSNQLAGACTGSNDGKDVTFQLAIPYRADLTGKLAPHNASSVYTTYVRGYCLTPSTEMMCSNDMITWGDEVATIDVADIPAGKIVYITVDATPTGDGPFTLSLALTAVLSQDEACDRFGFDSRCETGLTCRMAIDGQYRCQP